MEDKKCYKYTSKHGDIKIECSETKNKIYLSEDNNFKSEDINNCPFCGLKLMEFGYARWSFDNKGE